MIQAFVEEALNLSQFLEKVVVNKQSHDLYSPQTNDRTSTSLQNIDALDFNDWVSFLREYKKYLEFLKKNKKIEKEGERKVNKIDSQFIEKLCDKEKTTLKQIK